MTTRCWQGPNKMDGPFIDTCSPQSWASFNMLGDFDFSAEKLQFQNTIGVLPAKSRSRSSPKIGRREIDEIYAVSIGYRKSYGRLGTFEPLGPSMTTLSPERHSITPAYPHFSTTLGQETHLLSFDLIDLDDRSRNCWKSSRTSNVGRSI